MELLSVSPVLVEQVYRRLLGAIADQTLAPGQRVLQADLATALGVSRQPVSHALVLLKQHGLVQDAGKKGLEVTPIDPERIRQLYEVRAALDALSARLAAGRVAAGLVADGDIAALRDALASGAALDAAASIAALVEADSAFHAALYALSGNPTVQEVLAGHWPHLRRSMGTVLLEETYRRRAWAEHAAIVRHVLGGQAEHAADAAFAHADGAGRQTAQRLRRETIGNDDRETTR